MLHKTLLVCSALFVLAKENLINMTFILFTYMYFILNKCNIIIIYVTERRTTLYDKQITLRLEKENTYEDHKRYCRKNCAEIWKKNKMGVFLQDSQMHSR